MYWDKRYPKLITMDQMRDIYSENHKLKTIGDITCDPKGSIEFTLECTTIEDPVFIFNPEQGTKNQVSLEREYAFWLSIFCPVNYPESLQKVLAVPSCNIFLTLSHAITPINMKTSNYPCALKKVLYFITAISLRNSCTWKNL